MKPRDFIELFRLAQQGRRDLLLARITEEMSQSGFARNRSTDYAFRRVNSVLGRGGWNQLEPYITFKPGFRKSQKALTNRTHPLGVIVNRLVRGCRADESVAEAKQLPWVHDTPAGKAAAYMFHVTTLSPDEAGEELLDEVG